MDDVNHINLDLQNLTVDSILMNNDTLTYDKKGDELEQTNIPRNRAVMMVLNEVTQSNVNGGGSRHNSKAKRAKPEFILVADSQRECKEIITAFSDVFTTSVQSNKRDKYDVVTLTRDEQSGKLETTVSDFIAKEVKQREGVSRKHVDIGDIQNNLPTRFGSRID